MKRSPVLPAALFLLVLASANAGEMKDEVRVEGNTTGVLRTQFGGYPDSFRQFLYPEPGGLRFWVPGKGGAVPQTGWYSYFTLSGDCEASFTYEILNLQTPQGGYGSGVGLALDAGDGVGRGSIQRLDKDAREGGYVLQTFLGAGAKAKEEYRFIPSLSRKGRIGLRRVGKELIFLTADEPDAPLEEAGRLPFTERTIRAVRFFADTGGSPTALDARAREVRILAEEITGAVPQREETGGGAWWVVGAVAGVGLLYGGWWYRRRR